jgi:uncharacterized protein YjbI with pentapeptide repeats
MSHKEVMQLRSRWSGAQIESINRLLATGNVETIIAPTLPVGGIAMRDLRGIKIVEPIDGVVLRRIDFSYCTTGAAGSIISPCLEECAFVGADLRETNIGNRVVRCDFSDAGFHVLYGIYENCRFHGADLVGAKGSKLVFTGCDFTEANWRKATILRSRFDHCIWDRCRFRSGSFGFCHFIGGRPDPAALGNTMVGEAVYE